ncbi:hypothetical protein CSAL01_01572 [Colletotrichum salicis]|uniref:Uncharacterized protein n=1 Tax=Colletotrichum salicis TaxID=1209931 RepID=A0A135SHW7_9PEZI|nr:hypothetical protein CSAL01_01572 [Colletotrichum salicis]
MAPGIEDVAFEAIISFEELIRAWRLYNGGLSVAAKLPSLKSDLFRLKTWHGDFTCRAVAELDGRYLDHHLRNASHIQRQLLKLLSGLKESIVDAKKILTGQTVPWDKLSNKVNTSQDGMIEPQTELQQIATEICGLVDCLLRLRVATGDPAPHDRITSAKLRKNPEDFSFDVNFFKETWVRIEEFLAERLGKSVSQRRETLRQGAHERKSSTNSDLLHNEQSPGASSRHQKAAESMPPTILGSGSIKYVKTISTDEDLTLSEGARQILQSIEADVKNRREEEYRKRREEMMRTKWMGERSRAAGELDRLRQREQREARREKCGERRNNETQKDYEERMGRRWEMLWQGRGLGSGFSGLQGWWIRGNSSTEDRLANAATRRKRETVPESQDLDETPWF